MEQLQRAPSHPKRHQGVNASGKKALLRSLETDEITHLSFGPALLFADVKEQYPLLYDLMDDEFPVYLSAGFVAYAKAFVLVQRLFQTAHEFVAVGQVAVVWRQMRIKKILKLLEVMPRRRP